MNFNPKSPCSFAFRKEYFGGLFLDFENSSWECITPEEFQLLEKLKNGEIFFLQDLQSSELKKFTKKLRKKNIFQVDGEGKISVINIRKVSTPKVIPKDHLSAPLKIYDTYTRKCNLTCKHCYAASNPNFIEERRTLSQTKAIMKKFYDVGVLEWNFTGGEPTTASDLLDAIRIANSLRIKVSLNTNGCWSSEVSKKILTSGVKEIIISLEGQERTNDKKRGLGTFRKVMKTLDQIYKYNKSNSTEKIKAILNMTIGRDNVHDIEFMIRLATEFNCDIKFVPLKPSGRALEGFSERILSTKEYMQFAKKVQQLRENSEINKSDTSIILKHKDLFCPDYPDKSNFPYPFNNSECSALTTAMDILPDGKIVACSFLMDKPKFIGPNILDVSVYDAWQHPTMRLFRQAQKKNCADCKFYTKQCRGACRSTVLLNGGEIKDNKLLGEDPYCFKDLL